MQLWWYEIIINRAALRDIHKKFQQKYIWNQARTTLKWENLRGKRTKHRTAINSSIWCDKRRESTRDLINQNNCQALKSRKPESNEACMRPNWETVGGSKQRRHMSFLPLHSDKPSNQRETSLCCYASHVTSRASPSAHTFGSDSRCYAPIAVINCIPYISVEYIGKNRIHEEYI